MHLDSTKVKTINVPDSGVGKLKAVHKPKVALHCIAMEPMHQVNLWLEKRECKMHVNESVICEALF